MHLLRIFATVAAAFGTFVRAEKDDLHTRFVALAAQNGGIIPLDAAMFDQLTANNREWSATVQLTALSKNMNCRPCREFEPHFAAVAKSWTKIPQEKRDQHFFATLEFSGAMEIFKRLGLASAPVVYTYPAAKGPRRPANGKTDPHSYDFHAYGFEAEELAEQLSPFTPAPVPYSPPPNYGAIATAVSGVLTLILASRYILPILTSRWTWAAAIIGSCVIFTSGLMFVRIRGSPWVARGRNGQAQWMAAGYQNQYGMEVQVIGAVYLTAAFSYTALIFLVPRITSPAKQRVGVYLWCTISVMLLAMLLSFFRVKNPSYPFRLFF